MENSLLGEIISMWILGLKRLTCLQASSPQCSGGAWGGKRKGSLQLHLWNWNSTSNYPEAPR